MLGFFQILERDQPLDQTFENLKNTSRLQSWNYKFGKNGRGSIGLFNFLGAISQPKN